MAEVLVTFETPVRDGIGAYQARAIGRLGEDGMWQGWIEFIRVDGDEPVLVTPAETTQPERQHLIYWATGLTPIYLEGALKRARTPPAVHVRVASEPLSSGPARRPVVYERTVPPAEPVLDPFAIGARNLDILRQELSALNRPRLLNIIAAYDLNLADEDLSSVSDLGLVRLIVAAVDTQLAPRSRT